MSLELRDQHDGLELGIGAASTSYTLNQYSQYHGDVTNVQNHYHGRYQPGWKPSRRCAAIDFHRLSSHFCGRDRELEHLNNALKAGERSIRCAIQGISGLGKSHLAIKYGKTSYESEKYTHVFWISVDTETKLSSGLESILAKLNHPAQLENNQNAKVEIAKRWLEDAEEDQRWLLILDNARRESFESLRSKLPNESPHGHILLTTQFDDIAREFTKSQPNSSSLLRLQRLAVDDGVSLLIASSQMSSEKLSSKDRDRARRLVQRTGCHPLAITFAAACATTASTLPELLRQTTVDQLALITEHNDALADTDQRVIRQFFDRQIASIQDEPFALHVFRTISFLDNSSISVNMLRSGIQSVLESGVKLAFQLSDLHKAIQTLVGQNLVQVASAGIVTMHDLTNHMSIRSMEVANIASRYQGYANRIVSSAFDAIDEPWHRDNWRASDEVIPHLFKLSSEINSGLESALADAAQYLADRGRYSDSQTLSDRLLSIQRKTLGPEHLDTLTTMHTLARLSEQRGFFRRAVELNLHVLEERKKQLGPRHPDTLATMHNLAAVYDSQGHFKKSEKLFQLVWDGQMTQLGPTHYETLVTMHNLARVYESQGRLEKAEKLFQRVLDTRKKQLDPTHPELLATMHTLARVYEAQGRLRKSEKLFQQVLDGQKKQLGLTHPETLVTMHNLARVYESQGRLRKSEKLFQQVLDKEKQQLGPKHPDTLITMQSLAGVYESQGRQQKAEEFLLEVLAGWEITYGPKHKYTVTVREDLERVREDSVIAEEDSDTSEGWVTVTEG